MKRGVMAAVVAALFVVFSPTSAGAWFTYCDWDPIVLIVTPGGHVVPVYDSVWTSSLIDLGLPVESYTTSRLYAADGSPETAVDMTIYTPTGLLLRYHVDDLVTSGPLGTGTVYASQGGTSGSAVHLKFVLHTS